MGVPARAHAADVVFISACPPSGATNCVAEFHVIRTVNLGKWWRRLIEAAQAALVVLPR